MGPRAKHSSDQLRNFFLQAAYEIIETRGFNGLSARAVALKVGYSPGTIYNVFSNLDDLVLNVEARLLRELDEHLQVAAANSSRADAVISLARAFIEFACQRPNLWNLLAANQLSTRTNIPDWYLERLEAPQLRIAEALSADEKTFSDTDVKQRARTISAVLFGIGALATSIKTNRLTDHQALDIVEGLVRSYLHALPPQSVTV